MNISQRHFLGFIRYALMGGDYPHGMLTMAAWKEQQKLAKDQTVSGLLYNTVSQLPRDLRPPQQILAKLYSKVVYYEKMNSLLNERTCQIFRAYRELGVHPILLKGPAAATLYEIPEHRVFGDIDIFVNDPDGNLQAWAERYGDCVEPTQGREHIMAFQMDGVIVENHLTLLKFYNKTLAERMSAIVESEIPGGKTENFITLNDQQIEVLPYTLGLLYDIVHFSKHLISSGVGLRQLCDITLAMHKNHDCIDSEKLCQWLDQLEMRYMANALADAAVRHLGLPPEEVPYDYKSNLFGDKGDELMDLVMDGANFGYWLKRGKRKSWYNRLRQNLKQHTRIYPYMPKEVRTEMWLALTRRIKF